MIDYNTSQTIGLLFDAIGITILFFSSPIHLHPIEAGRKNNIQKRGKRNRLMKIGFYLILLGFLVQILGNVFLKVSPSSDSLTSAEVSKPRTEAAISHQPEEL